MRVYDAVKALEREHDVDWGFTWNPQVRFANGWSLSVAGGPGNYCSSRFGPHAGVSMFDAESVPSEVWLNEDAEVAIFDPANEWFFCPNIQQDCVWGWKSAEDVLWLAYLVAAYDPNRCPCPTCRPLARRMV